MAVSQLPSVKQYVRYELHRRQDEFTDRRSLTIFAGSLNVHALEPNESLHDWLVSPVVAAGVPRPDIYAVGFQELVELNTGNVIGTIGGILAETRGALWTSVILKELNTGSHGDDSYELVLCNHLVGICLLIFAQKRHVPHISGVNGQTTGTGVLGMMGNKGACAIRLHLYDSSICFVCSHLAAHRSNVVGRNKDFANIVSRTRFRHQSPDAESQFSIDGDSGTSAILDHEFVLWMGDLNYRFQSGVSLEECMRHIDARALGSLRQQDQLNVERAQARSFAGFDEGLLDFLPTYKFVHGTDRYDQGGEAQGKKPRMPAWTDRILWYEKPRVPGQLGRIKQVLYQSCMEVKASDHRPVLAIFDVQVKVVAGDRRQEICDEVVRRHDMWENQSIPKVQLSVNTLSFEDLRFARPSTQSLKLRNVGQAPAVFCFVPKGDQIDLCQSWLTVTPPQGVLMPGSEEVVSVSACVDALAARSADQLSDILVLHVENGSDYFIMIQGNYVGSCFGASIEALAEKTTGADATVPGVPGAIVQLVGALRHRECWKASDIFMEGGSPTEFQEIRDCFDSDRPLGEASVHSLAEALVEFLMSTATPLIPVSLLPHAHVADDAMAVAWGHHLLAKLPEAHHSTFMFLMEFLREPLDQEMPVDAAASIDLQGAAFDSFNLEGAASMDSQRSRRKFDPLVMSTVFAGCFLQVHRTEFFKFAAHRSAAHDCLQRMMSNLLTAASLKDAIQTPPTSPPVEGMGGYPASPPRSQACVDKPGSSVPLVDINEFLS